MAEAAVLSPNLLEAHNPSPMTGRGNNTYLLVDAGVAALIDAGVGDPRHLGAIGAALGASGAVLRDVLVTHGHADHASGAPAIAAAHARARFLKYPWPEEDARYAVAWRSLAAGERVRVGHAIELEVLHTGGHSPDHVVFWHASTRTGFTGDLVVEGSSVMIQSSRGGDLREYMAALERLIALDPAALYPAHGPVITRPAPVLRGYLQHRRLREQQVLAALAAGRATVHAIADFIYDDLDPALMPAARENVQAHLHKLAADGLARNDNDRWSI